MSINHKKVISWPGQTLVEVIVALAVAVVLAVSLITMSLITQKSARSARNNSQATKLVQEYLEQIRIIRDRRGFGVLVDGTCYTIAIVDPDPIPQLSISGCPTGEVITLSNTSFSRRLAISTPGANPNVKLVVVTASWADSGGTQTVNSQTFLTKWEGF